MAENLIAYQIQKKKKKAHAAQVGHAEINKMQGQAPCLPLKLIS